MLLRAIETLGERDRQIILLRFGIGGAREATQKEVADLLGISQSYISRLEKPPLCLSFFHAALNALHTAKEQEHHKIDHHDARAGRRLEHIRQHHAEQEIHH